MSEPERTSLPFAGLPAETIASFSGQTILITGGRGYIGSALAQSLSGVDCRLILVDRSSEEVWRPQASCAEISIITGDITKRETWQDLLAGVDYVFHLAENRYVHRSEQDLLIDLERNALPILHLLEACRKHRFDPKIVFTSSANLFGATDKLPVNEDQRDEPLIAWAVHKLMAEGYLHVYAKKYGIKSVILRLANVYGPTARLDVMATPIVNRMIARALNNESLTLYANHNCVRDYIFLQDVLQALLMAGCRAELKDGQHFVIGSGEPTTISEAWQLIADEVSLQTGLNVPVTLDDSIEVEPFEMRNFVADTTRFRQATAWKPQVNLKQGINLTTKALVGKASN